MDGERPRYVTACAMTDSVDGWREHRADGGVLIDVANDRVVAEGLSMPHSPRLHEGFVWLHDSGSGYLCRIDPNSGRRENIAFCPGFLRGLVLLGHYAGVTLSQPRRGRFQGLALDEELARRKVGAWCGIMIIDTRHGDVIAWVRFDNEIELFDVVAVPSARCAMMIAPDSSDLQDTITFEDLVPTKPSDDAATREPQNNIVGGSAADRV